MTVTKWTAEQVRALRQQMRLTQEEFAQVCKVNRNTVIRWEAGDRPALGNMITLDRLSQAEAE